MLIFLNCQKRAHRMLIKLMRSDYPGGTSLDRLFIHAQVASLSEQLKHTMKRIIKATLRDF
ncbi:hypothetical protein PQO03_13175 [Lentisphaera profundi]|uniref:Uncharacterized protein n=1 Tax=Lentisphaera profundi TaxID=1658616 RepID=A0ABY7W3E6_9BACT|nr:hypothetical protein [Lentisphaera profundi]WDE98788.1 hypothetical protein PQO03_13175 [Lentisphaera profundi]